MVSVTSWPLYHWKGTLVPFNRRLSGPHSQSKTFWRSEKSLASNVIRTPEYPAHNLVTIPPMLSWSSTNLCIFMNTETYITYYLIQGCEGDSMMCHIICKLYAETTISLWDLFFFSSLIYIQQFHIIFLSAMQITDSPTLTNTSP